MTDAGMLKTTTDYDKFELLPFNRDVKDTKLLEESMREHGWIPAYPMHVVKNGNGKYKIKAGHNRFTVARKLGIPVKYVICDDNASIHRLEKTTRSWSLEDYLASYVREGRHTYIIVKQYRERTGIGLGACISMLAGQSACSGNHTERFKSGVFEPGDPLHSEIVADVVLHLRDKCKLSWASNSLLVQAISKVVWVDEFDPEQFKHKASQHRSLLEKQPNLQSYLSMLEDVYNRQSKSRIPLAFLADEAAKKRSAVNPSKPK